MLQRALEPEVDVAIQFLQRWAQQGPWVLTALDPDCGFIRTKGFDTESLAICRHWIQYWQTCESPRNIYFQVNLDRRPLDEIDKKSRKDHIAAVVALHADIDAYKDGEELAAGRQRVLSALTDDLPPGVPGPPSVINSSGNGYNVLWRLRQPIVIDGDVAKAVEIERYNRWLAVTYGGDMTIDVSRILRLPGTVNFPNERKRARGLVPVLSHQVLYDDARRYDLEAFQAVEGRIGDALPADTDRGWQSIEIEGVEQEHVDALPPRMREIVVKGRIEGETLPGDDSRSGWAFYAALLLLRHSWPPGLIVDLLMDGSYGISEGPLDKPDPEREARRTVWRAMQMVATWDAESGLRLDLWEPKIEQLDFAPVDPEPLDFGGDDD